MSQQRARDREPSRVTSILTYILTFIIAIAPSEDEFREDATLQVRIAELNRRLSDRAR